MAKDANKKAPKNKIPETRQKLAKLPPGLEFPERLPNHLKGKIRYDSSTQALVFKGVMHHDEKRALLKLSRQKSYRQAIRTLFETTRDAPDLQRLKLDVKERRWWLFKVLAPLITITTLIVLYGVRWHWHLQTLRQREIANIKKDFFSGNVHKRIGAAHALVPYTDAAIPLFIRTLETGTKHPKLNDAIEISLVEIGRVGVMGLVKELRRLKNEMKQDIEELESSHTKLLTEHLGWGNNEFDQDKMALLKEWMENNGLSKVSIADFLSKEQYAVPRSKAVKKLIGTEDDTELPSLEVLYHKPIEDIKTLLSKFRPKLEQERIDLILANAQAHKNIKAALVDILCNNQINGLLLSELDLSGSSLVGANLIGANLVKANLKGTQLFGANLSGARLDHANLSDANLGSANLSDAKLPHANLERTSLFGANLSRVQMGHAKLSEAILTFTTLSHASLPGANLSRVHLVGADISNANFADTNLSGSNLWEANLSGTNFSGANLSGMKGLRNVENFTGTNLKGVKGLSRKQLEYAKSEGAIIE
ncbi:MAG: hypothetical protein GY800_13895 [Planctomycetes bacterium]|nr:hypothetical protein [Planctomycetota bacterium]